MRIVIAAVLALLPVALAAQAPADRPARLSSDVSTAAGAASRVAPSLPELVAAAWARSGLETLEQARGAELDARASALRSPFAGPPSIGLDVRRDLPRPIALPGTEVSAERGRNEIEPAIAAPLWLPGQRDAQRGVIERERAQRSAGLRLARLALAGEVREAAWALSAAAIERRVQQAREASAALLEADVGRRVEAGDLAPVDRLAARTERLAALGALREAEAREREAASRLRTITGLEGAGELVESPREGAQAESLLPDAQALERHPVLAVAREALDTARARLDAARASRRDAPTLSAAARFDRDAYGGDYRNSVRIGIVVPLDTEARNAPRLAAAGVELAEAELALLRAQREQAAQLERARLGLDASRAAVALDLERAATAGAAQQALERAFRAGERALPDVLRARQTALDAELAAALAKAREGLALARLNQALGVEP
jgi:cobalt-zinc-cadmium efflux system outer membrane protein